MKFIATDAQLLQVIQKAVNASLPAGMGWLHFKKKDYSIKEIKSYIGDQVSRGKQVDVDYFEGRMVKLRMRKVGEHWEVNNTLNPEYQSFVVKYSSMKDLLSSVEGLTIVEG